MQQSDFIEAICVAAFASLLVALIEIPSSSKASLWCCLVAPSLIYWMILALGNVVTTLLACTFVDKLPPSLSAYDFLFAAFFGVFAFEAILKNTNVTMFDRGVLTIQSWVDKAKDNASVAAIDRQEAKRQSDLAATVDKLMTFDEEELNTRILQQKNDDQLVGKLEAAARASGANPKKYKAFQLAAMLSGSETLAIRKG